MGNRSYTGWILCAASLVVLTACEKTKEQFDFSKKPPDEFAVVGG